MKTMRRFLRGACPRKNIFGKGRKIKAFAGMAAAFFLFLCLIFPFAAKTVPPCRAAAQTADALCLSPRPASPVGGTKKEVLLSRFTTEFDGSNLTRSHNIRLASRKIDGCVLPAGGAFSFNGRVGERTKARGFQEAPVIFEGEFVRGTGGGVCQVSTTLYNAALLAGMTVTEVHAHSLRVGYVPPSLDAMVSSASDLRFCNPSPAPAVIRMYTEKNSVTAEIYGRKTADEYRTESVVLRRLSPPPAEVVEGEEDCVLKREKEGMKSESYLFVYRRGRRLRCVRIRRDTYAFVQGKVQKKRTETAEEVPEAGERAEGSNSCGKVAQND